MSGCEASDEDLTHDSVPDPPRANATDRPPRENGVHKDEKSRKGKKETDEKSSKSSKSKNSKKPFDFLMGQGPASSTTINIQSASNIQIGHVINVNLQPKNKQSHEKTPTDVEELMASREVVTRDDLDIVATHTGEGWRDVGKKLGFSSGQLTQIEKNAQVETSDFKEKVYQMLLAWKQEKDKEATVGVLCRSLWNSKERDAARFLAKERSSN